MRLDHLLSREPIIVGNDHGVRPVGGGLGLFSCACMCSLPKSGWWVWVRVWVGHKKLYERTHCRVHVQHRVSVRHCVVVARMPGLRVLFLGFWVCVVGCL